MTFVWTFTPRTGNQFTPRVTARSLFGRTTGDRGLTDGGPSPDAALANSSRSIRPATSMVEVAALIDPGMLVEIEADAFVP